MKVLTTAIYGKLSGSALAAHIGTRLYKGRAPEGATYPYIVYMLVANAPDNTFTENLEDVLIQFSCFSSASGSTEIEDIYTDLKTLYDDCTMTITGSTFLYMQRTNASLMVEDHTTTGGLIQVWHYAVDYNIKTKVG